MKLAINEAIDQEMTRDPTVIMLGEDIVGGAGGNAVNNMIVEGLQGVEFVVANTDAQALTMSKASRLIQLG
ncbi:hypothetical protein EN817_30815, partial [Mesorhizobium sp. M3A.F.Ca.ET.174.01.1.1]